MRALIGHVVASRRLRAGVTFEYARIAMAAAPLAEFGNRTENLDPILFLSGIAVLSAGLVVMRAARFARERVPRIASEMAQGMAWPEAAGAPFGEPGSGAREREVLLEALAGAASMFYSIAGALPRDASVQAVRKADDLRELVWLNRLPERGERSVRSTRSITGITRRH